MFTALTCLAFLALTGWFAWYKTRGTLQTSAGYFMAGHSLGPVFIAGSLLLTNISAELFVGQSGLAYFGNLTPLAWEVWAVRGIILLALLFLPMYLGGAFSTIPEFLQLHYGTGMRRLSAVLFMSAYIFVWSPTVIYGGALAIMEIMQVEAWFNLSRQAALWWVTAAIGIMGALYAVAGGLRAVAISDTLVGCGLLVMGCLIPVLGLMALGDKTGGGISGALHHIATCQPEKLNAVGLGSELDALPVGAVFTGLMVTVTFYWGTNQYVIQRALAARSLTAGQKGLLLAGFFKFLVPVIAVFPGLLAWHLYGAGLEPRDLAYPVLVTNLLPPFMRGLFAAVLLGAVFSTYNSLLNSAATLFAVDFYKPLINPRADDRRVILISRWFGSLCALLTIITAPFLVYAPEGLFIFLQQYTGFLAIPLVSLVLLGLFAGRLQLSGRAAQAVTWGHLVFYYLLVFQFRDDISLHWMHVYGILFLAELLILFICALCSRQRRPQREMRRALIDMHAWHYAVLTSCMLLCAAALCYLLFSPIGFASPQGVVSDIFWPCFGAAAGGSVVFCLVMHWKVQPLYEKYIDDHYHAKVAGALESSIFDPDDLPVAERLLGKKSSRNG